MSKRNHALRGFVCAFYRPNVEFCSTANAIEVELQGKQRNAQTASLCTLTQSAQFVLDVPSCPAIDIAHLSRMFVSESDDASPYHSLQKIKFGL